nr:BTAD domain-containing putative transcriptional regulator [Nesterenkonia alkaliphila]
MGSHVLLHLRPVGQPVAVGNLGNLQSAVAEVSKLHVRSLPSESVQTHSLSPYRCTGDGAIDSRGAGEAPAPGVAGHGKRANVRIEVLGPVQLRDDDGAAVEVPERKVRALLAALTAAAGETVSAEALIDRAWGQDLPSNPPRVLQAKLSQLRSLLDTASPGGRDLLLRSPGGYRLDLTAGTCDAAEFRTAVRSATGLPAGPQRAELLEAALKLWRGPAYAEFTDELWLAAEIAELQELRLRAVELAAEALVAAGTAEQAVTLASVVRQ